MIWLTPLPALRSAAVTPDERYQQFMVDYFDPLFGRARSLQMQALMAETVTLYLSGAEKQINRQIAYSLLGLGAMLTTLWLYAPALWLFALPMLYMNSHVYKRAYQVLKAGQINYYVLMVFSFTGLVLGGYFVAGMVSAVTYNVIEKLLAITQDRSYHGLANIFGQQVRTVWLATRMVLRWKFLLPRCRRATRWLSAPDRWRRSMGGWCAAWRPLTSTL